MRRLLGGDAVNRRGQPLGRIVDIAVEPTRGVVAFIVIRYDGTSADPSPDDAKGKTFLIPLAACHIEADRVVLDVEPTVFARSPGRG